MPLRSGRSDWASLGPSQPSTAAASPALIAWCKRSRLSGPNCSCMAWIRAGCSRIAVSTATGMETRRRRSRLSGKSPRRSFFTDVLERLPEFRRLLLTGALNRDDKLALIERTLAGQVRARATGTHMGRPVKTTDEQCQTIRKRLTAGHTVSAVARDFKIFERRC